MAPSYSGVWNISTQYQYRTGWPVDANLGAIGLYAGGVKTEGGTSYLAEVDKLTLAGNSNATDFGDLSTNRGAFGTASSDTRMLTGGGFYNDAGGNDVQINIIEYFTYATAGNSTDFGDLSATKYLLNGLSNNVRGIFHGGSSGGSTINVIEYVTIASTGDVTDFGNLSGTYSNHGYGICASTTRGIIAGFNSNVIEYITIASAGNSTDFGDMTVTRKQGYAQMASATRGVFGGGRNSSNAAVNVIDYITIASTGNAQDFGDLAAAKYTQMGMSSLTKGFIVGGYASSYENVIEQITFSTTGNATDFGDLTRGKGLGNGASNGQAAFQDTAFAPAAIGLLVGIGASGGHTTIQYVDITTTGSFAMFGDIHVGSDYDQANGTIANATRGVFAEGATGNTYYYSTFSTKGKTTNFGNVATNSFRGIATSNGTRGLRGGGFNGSAYQNNIEYITIASTGNGTDFGDLSSEAQYGAAASSTTRSVFHLGGTGGSGTTAVNTLEYVTIGSTGNTTDFGDLTSARDETAAVNSSTRGVFGGGDTGSVSNVMDYITLASTGNAIDFGDLTVAKDRHSGICSTIRGLFTDNADGNLTVDYITIASTGNGTDFGDPLTNSYRGTGSSNSHGGIA